MKKLFGATFVAIMMLMLSGCKLPPVQITTVELESNYAALGQPYTQTISVSGGTGKTSALRFSIVSGALPMGLNLDSLTGVIQGTPTLLDESTTFTLRVDDIEAAQKNGENDPNNFAQQQYSLSIVDTPFSADEFEALDDNHYAASRNVLNLQSGLQVHNFHLPDDVDIYIIDLSGIDEGTPLAIETHAIEGQTKFVLKAFQQPYRRPYSLRRYIRQSEFKSVNVFQQNHSQ